MHCRILPVVPPRISKRASAGWIRSVWTLSKSMPLRIPKGRTINAFIKLPINIYYHFGSDPNDLALD